MAALVQCGTQDLCGGTLHKLLLVEYYGKFVEVFATNLVMFIFLPVFRKLWIFMKIVRNVQI